MPAPEQLDPFCQNCAMALASPEGGRGPSGGDDIC